MKTIILINMDIKKFIKLTKTTEKNIENLNKMMSNLGIEIEFKFTKIEREENETNILVKDIIKDLVSNVKEQVETDNPELIPIDQEQEIDLDEFIEFIEKDGVNFFKCEICDKEGKKSGLKKHLSSKTHVINFKKFNE